MRYSVPLLQLCVELAVFSIAFASACNTCQPPMAQPCGMNTVGPCTDGTCGSGVYDQNPASIPASGFATPNTGIQYYNQQGIETLPSSEVYGNSNMVTPPIGPANGG